MKSNTYTRECVQKFEHANYCSAYITTSVHYLPANYICEMLLFCACFSITRFAHTYVVHRYVPLALSSLPLCVILEQYHTTESAGFEHQRSDLLLPMVMYCKLNVMIFL